MNDFSLRHPPATCPMCGGAAWERRFVYDAPPEGEVQFTFSEGGYYREVWRCGGCGHHVSLHDLDAGALYEGGYVDATYGDELLATFDRIVALPPDRSDNAGRVRRLVGYADAYFPADRRAAPSVLDVGSGLCVFLHALKRHGWRCTALDPDPRQAEHARTVVGVPAICADFLRAGELGRHDVVTFNKVLEHVPDPVSMLARARDCLEPGGFVYVEMPDAAAAVEGPGREEFFIDHHHVFSMASLVLLAERAGFAVDCVERLREPSTKYTLRLFGHLQSASKEQAP